jgi:hypothetical protein
MPAFQVNEAGYPARAVMAAFQKNPQILMTHAGNGIESIEDMRGKPVMISASSRTTFGHSCAPSSASRTTRSAATLASSAPISSTRARSGIVETEDTSRLGIGAMTDERWKPHFALLVDQG